MIDKENIDKMFYYRDDKNYEDFLYSGWWLPLPCRQEDEKKLLQAINEITHRNEKEMQRPLIVLRKVYEFRLAMQEFLDSLWIVQKIRQLKKLWKRSLFLAKKAYRFHALRRCKAFLVKHIYSFEKVYRMRITHGAEEYLIPGFYSLENARELAKVISEAPTIDDSKFQVEIWQLKSSRRGLYYKIYCYPSGPIYPRC